MNAMTTWLYPGIYRSGTARCGCPIGMADESTHPMPTIYHDESICQRDLPEHLRDPQKCLERGRELLRKGRVTKARGAVGARQ